MKKTFILMGANVLALCIALTRILASNSQGTVVSDPGMLTRITGSACVYYQSQSCNSGHCDASTCKSYAGGSSTKGTDDGSVDCSSDEGWTCGSCHTYTKCGS